MAFFSQIFAQKLMSGRLDFNSWVIISDQKPIPMSNQAYIKRVNWKQIHKFNNLK